MKNIAKLILTVAILVSINFAANAQPGSTSTGGGFDDEPQDVPVDGGIVLLAAEGAAYGYKKLKTKK
ncbi:MAG: PID-CTERM protein-sorting domain-containing protein [Candidatus Methylacidiphilales bacterium]